MGRRGPQPDYARREAFAKLITEGVSSKEACRVVGIHPRTGVEWRNGRRRIRRGRVLLPISGISSELISEIPQV